MSYHEAILIWNPQKNDCNPSAGANLVTSLFLLWPHFCWALLRSTLIYYETSQTFSERATKLVNKGNEALLSRLYGRKGQTSPQTAWLESSHTNTPLKKEEAASPQFQAFSVPAQLKPHSSPIFYAVSFGPCQRGQGAVFSQGFEKRTEQMNKQTLHGLSCSLGI